MKAEFLSTEQEFTLLRKDGEIIQLLPASPEVRYAMGELAEYEVWMSARGAEAWSAERCPDWTCYCSAGYQPGKETEFQFMELIAPSAATAEAFVEQEIEAGNLVGDPRHLVLHTCTWDAYYLGWMHFAELHRLVYDVRDCVFPGMEHREPVVGVKSRTWCNLWDLMSHHQLIE